MFHLSRNWYKNAFIDHTAAIPHPPDAGIFPVTPKLTAKKILVTVEIPVKTRFTFFMFN